MIWVTEIRSCSRGVLFSTPVFGAYAWSWGREQNIELIRSEARQKSTNKISSKRGEHICTIPYGLEVFFFQPSEPKGIHLAPHEYEEFIIFPVNFYHAVNSQIHKR